jgi:hypothetical protein
VQLEDLAQERNADNSSVTAWERERSSSCVGESCRRSPNGFLYGVVPRQCRVADSRSFFILPLWSPVNQRSIGARFPAARITCLPASRIWALIFLWGVRDTALELLGVRLAQVPPLHNRLAESGRGRMRRDQAAHAGNAGHIGAFLGRKAAHWPTNIPSISTLMRKQLESGNDFRGR